MEGKFKFLEEWIEFYHPKRHDMFISQDTWNKVLIFAWKVDRDLGECMVMSRMLMDMMMTMISGVFDEDDDWPVLISDFIVHARPIVNRRRKRTNDEDLNKRLREFWDLLTDTDTAQTKMSS